MAVGTPVLISDQTPWRDLDDAGVGWVRQLEKIQEFIDVIEHVYSQTKNEHIEQRNLAKQYALSMILSGEALKQNKLLFDALYQQKKSVGVSHSSCAE